MDTKQRARSAAQQRSRSTGKKKKKQNPIAAILGAGQKQPAKKAPARKATAASQRRPQQAGARRTQAPTRSPEEMARRREAAARRAAEQERAAQSAQLQERLAAEQAIPEEVFDTAQKTARTRTPEEQKRREMRRRSANRSRERKKQAEKAKNRPAVAYVQPRPFNLNRLLLQLAVVVAVVLAVVIGLSVFFKVETVKVYGNNAYSAWTIQEASGIEGGENLLTFGRPRACGKIITALPYVKTARIGIKLPDTVNIYIEEFDVAYAIQSDDATWWLMTATGKVTEQIDAGTAGNYTRVEGVTLDSPAVGRQAVAKEAVVIPPETTDSTAPTEETAPVSTVTANDRLQAALLILTSLEANDIVGEVASFNVTTLTNIEMMYGQRYQVKLGDTSRMDEKISYMKSAVAQLNDYQTGILDISFTTWTDRPGYTPLG